MAVFLRGFRRVDRAGRGIDDRPTARRRAQKERAGGSWIQTVGLDRNPRDAVVHQVQEPFAGRPCKPEPVVLGSVIGIGTVEQRIALIDDALAKAARLVYGGNADSTLMRAT